MTKEKVIGTLKSLPNEFDVEELIEKLIFLQQVDEGLRQSKNQEVISLDEAKMKMSKWLQ